MKLKKYIFQNHWKKLYRKHIEGNNNKNKNCTLICVADNSATCSKHIIEIEDRELDVFLNNLEKRKY